MAVIIVDSIRKQDRAITAFPCRALDMTKVVCLPCAFSDVQAILSWLPQVKEQFHSGL